MSVSAALRAQSDALAIVQALRLREDATHDAMILKLVSEIIDEHPPVTLMVALAQLVNGIARLAERHTANLLGNQALLRFLAERPEPATPELVRATAGDLLDAAGRAAAAINH